MWDYSLFIFFRCKLGIIVIIVCETDLKRSDFSFPLIFSTCCSAPFGFRSKVLFYMTMHSYFCALLKFIGKKI